MGLSGIFVRDTFTPGVAAAEASFVKILEEDVLNTAIDALEYAKQNAPWEDRTGDARDGLDVEVEWQGHVVVWTMFHTVDYGLYLETRWSGRYAIIMPTLEQFAPRVGNGLSEFGDADYG